MKQKVLTALCIITMSTALLSGCGGSTDQAGTSSETEAAADTKDKEGTEASEKTENTEDTAGETGQGETAISDEQAQKAVSEEDAQELGFTDGAETQSQTNDTADSQGDSQAAKEEVILDTSSQLTGIHHAQIQVKDYGTIEVELDADTAPITVTNFVKLAQEDFYDGLTFHRIMDGFMIQGGDPKGNGTGGSDETIKGEFSNNGVDNDISHVRGTISMARSSQPDSASSQFFIVQTDSVFLDGDYAAFGKVTEGMDIVDEICKDAVPTDSNGTIPAEEQPVIESVVITD